MASRHIRLLGALSSVTFLIYACGSGSSPEPEVKDDGSEVVNECETDLDCDDGLFCTGKDVCNEGQCEASRPCLTSQSCDEEVQRCFTECARERDADGDGHDAQECGGDDCDDSNAQRYPGNAEMCDEDNVDEDCDLTTFGERDEDQDGYSSDQCCNQDGDTPSCGLDCNDKDRSTNPNSPEVCDGFDTNCNGLIDDGGDRFWRDADEDGYGDVSDEQRACDPPKGYVRNNEDCDDSDKSLHPKQPDDTCNLTDEDCDGALDEDVGEANLTTLYVDGDGDGFGTAGLPSAKFCVDSYPGYADNFADCVDDDQDIFPAAPDKCDRKINQCSSPSGEPGAVDADDDQDKDGFAGLNATCEDGYPKTDCDESTRFRNPDGDERCNHVDDDCDTVLDNTCPESVSLSSSPSVVPLTAGAAGSWYRCPTGQALTALETNTFPPLGSGLQLTCSTVKLTEVGYYNGTYSDTYLYYLEQSAPTSTVSVGLAFTALGIFKFGCDFNTPNQPDGGFATGIRVNGPTTNKTYTLIGIACGNFLAQRDSVLGVKVSSNVSPTLETTAASACPEGAVVTGLDVQVGHGELSSGLEIRNVECSDLDVVLQAGL